MFKVPNRNMAPEISPSSHLISSWWSVPDTIHCLSDLCFSPHRVHEETQANPISMVACPEPKRTRETKKLTWKPHWFAEGNRIRTHHSNTMPAQKRCGSLESARHWSHRNSHVPAGLLTVLTLVLLQATHQCSKWIAALERICLYRVPPAKCPRSSDAGSAPQEHMMSIALECHRIPTPLFSKEPTFSLWTNCLFWDSRKEKGKQPTTGLHIQGWNEGRNAWMTRWSDGYKLTRMSARTRACAPAKGQLFCAHLSMHACCTFARKWAGR